jgi:hypothetical protein
VAAFIGIVDAPPIVIAGVIVALVVIVMGAIAAGCASWRIRLPAASSSHARDR